MTSARLGSAIGGPPGTGYASRVVPGTASRLLASAMQKRPMSRGGIGLQTPVNIADRPVTQQGLSGLRTAGGTGRVPQRQFQDKSYFMGVLRAKMGELQTEINRLRQETAAATDEQSTFLAYDKRVKELAAELTEAQGVLGDYNLLVDKLNTDSERSEVTSEVAQLKVQNESESKEVEAIFAEKQSREAQINVLEKEIDQERHMADNLVSAMQPNLRERYLELKTANMQYQKDLETMNQSLDSLSSKRAMYEDELSVSAVKREAVQLYEKLRTVEKNRDDLLLEEQERGTPSQERERLLTQVKDDNKEISTMERQIAEVQESINQLNDEQANLDRDLEESQSEKNTKYRELRRREETMDNFLSSFDDNKAQELERFAELENTIEELTLRMSQILSSSEHLPSKSDFVNMKEDLAFRESELDKSKQTLEGLNREHGQLNANLEKIEALEDKIKAEMETLKDKMATMEESLATYSNLERLRDIADDKRKILEDEHLNLGSRRIVAKQNLSAAQEMYDSLARKLAENETYVQLNNLEKKWSHLEQNNFAISEYIAHKKAELNVDPVKNKVLRIQWQYNQMLIESLKNKPSSY